MGEIDSLAMTYENSTRRLGVIKGDAQMKVLVGCLLMTVCAFGKFTTDDQNAMNPPYGIFNASCLDASTFQSGSNRELSETFTYLFLVNCSNFHITRTIMGADILTLEISHPKIHRCQIESNGKAIEENS